MNEPRPPQQMPQNYRPASGQAPAAQRPNPNAPPRIPGMPVQQTTPIDLDPIELVEEEPPPPSAHVTVSPSGVISPNTASASTSAPSKIRAFGSSIGNVSHQQTFKRQTHANGTGAIRIRTFHGRLSDEGLVYMDAKINEWLDQHPDIEVKCVTTTVGMYEGKIKEEALILNVWY